MIENINLNEIKPEDFIPHRDPMLFVDKVLELSETHIKTEKTFKDDFIIFKGHFPGYPILPGVLAVEALAQSGALWFSLNEGLTHDKVLFLFMGVDNTKFKKPILPNDKVVMEVHLSKKRSPILKFDAKAYVNDELAVETSFTAKYILK